MRSKIWILINISLALVFILSSCSQPTAIPTSTQVVIPSPTSTAMATPMPTPTDIG